MTKWKCTKLGCMLSPCLFETGNEKMTPCLCPFSRLTQPEWVKQEEPATTATTTDTLPDWCKVGEWVYDKERKEYFKITKVDCLISIQNADWKGQCGHRAFTGTGVQARLRPYNADEMRELVGKVIESKNKVDCLLVTAYNSGTELYDVASVRTLGEWVTAEELLRIGYTIDGSPCGKFEHLEDGEWVE